MRTDELISAIAADAASAPRRLTPAVWTAIAVAVVGAAVVFWSLLGPRPDFWAAMDTMRFPFKLALVAGLTLAAGTFALRLARPGADPRAGRIALLAVAATLVAAIAAELVAVPREAWTTRLVGTNWAVCLVNIPILSALPLAVLLVAMRRGAPGSPAGLGAASGLFAGAIGATFYAFHCFDDSPLFVATWYSLAVGLVTLVGAAIGARLFKW